MKRVVARAASYIVVLAGLATSTMAQVLPTDPSIVTGTLDNGLTYMVKQHNKPEGRAVVWIHFHTGSLNETDRQRGIAHYLEHMAFNGSENFEPGSLIPFFQSLGMTFGRDQNAFTSFDQTTYQLSLPDTKPETLDKGLQFFADVTGRLLLSPTEIESERGIIQEERRRSLSGRQRVGYHVIEHMAPGSLFGQRIPIGTEETIGSVQEQDFKDYYGKWYAASNATLMIVADEDPTKIVAEIKDNFGSLPKKPRPTSNDINVRAYDKSFAIVAHDPEVRSEELQIVRLEPARPATTTIPQFRDDLVAALGQMALNRRLSDKVSAGGTSYLSARVGMGNESNAIYTAEMSGRAQPGKWREALNEMALELQRARAFGFTQRELDDARKDIIAGAERAVETEATLPAGSIIGAMNASVASGEPLMSAAQQLKLLQDTLPKITPEEVSRRFAKEFETSKVCFVATMPSGPTVPTEAQLLEAGTAALNVKPTEESQAEHATELMAKAPTAGKVESGTVHEASSVWSGWLSNNVRVHHKFMDERKSQVSISIDLIGGEVLETAGNRGITTAAQLAWARPATRNLTSSDIRSIMTGKKVNVRGGGGMGGRGGRGGGGGGSTDSISLSVSGSPEELETGMQLAYLLLTEPKIEKSSFDQFQIAMKTALQESLKNPQAVGARAAASVMYPTSDARLQPVTEEQIDALTLDASQAWLEQLIKTSPIEVVIVGDISRDAALDLAAKYIGALPSRERVSEKTLAAQRTVERPKGPRTTELSIETPTPQAFVMSGFYGADQANLADARALSLASRILSTRMISEVREKAQLVYSIGAGSRAASTYPGFGLFSAAAPTDPPKAQPLIEKLASMYATFAKEGPTQDELDVARKQFANTYAEQVKEPGYWSGRLSQITFRGASLDDVVNEQAAIEAITAEEIKAAFAKYATPENVITVVVTPANAPAGSAPAAPATPDATK
jgi:zinc protease